MLGQNEILTIRKKAGYEVSKASLGTWQAGGRQGEVFDEIDAEDILNCSIGHGIIFFDTADVYYKVMSKKAIGKVLKNRSERIIAATKYGREVFCPCSCV
ncbi:MAG: aldo/keto reductase, partial [Clostridia bacterium]